MHQTRLHAVAAGGCMSRKPTVPHGQGLAAACLCMQAQQGRGFPWALSFSFGRALQASVLKLWSEGHQRGADMQQVWAGRAGGRFVGAGRRLWVRAAVCGGKLQAPHTASGSGCDPGVGCTTACGPTSARGRRGGGCIVGAAPGQSLVPAALPPAGGRRMSGHGRRAGSSQRRGRRRALQRAPPQHHVRRCAE